MMSVSNAQTDEDTSLNKHTENYRSYLLVHVKRGVIKSLYDKHDTDLVKEEMHLRKVFVKNGYPEEFLKHRDDSNRKERQNS